jgi:hypothetical protein
MPITFSCDCGKQLRVKDELAGKRVKCPACGEITAVPDPEPQFEVVEDPPPRPAPKPVAKVVAKPKPAPAPEYELDDDPPPPKAKKKAPEYELDDDPKPAKKPIAGWKKNAADEDEDDRPARKKKWDEDEDDDRPRKKKKRKASSSGGRVKWKAVWGGLACLVIGLGLSAVLFFLDRWSPYLLIVSAAGLIGMIGGFLGYGGDDDSSDD